VDHDLLDATGWREQVEQVEQMDPADLRMLALSMPLIEQAKGILMGHYGCDATTAFTIRRRWSAVRQLRLRDLAASLVTEACRLEEDLAGDRPFSPVERFLTVHGLG
jgi:hypothetical protein